MKYLTIILLLFSLGFMNACSTVGVALGRDSSPEESGIGSAITDIKIQIAINDLWFQYNVDAFRKLDITVHNGRVLVTGVVQEAEHRVEAVRLAWQPKGVKQVINEIRIDESGGPGQYARDVFITSKVRAGLILESDVKSLHYTIDTVKGTVYLMGLARSEEELDRAKEIASNTGGVVQVVSYVKVVDPDL